MKSTSEIQEYQKNASPFKFLNSFGAEDKEVFFGRDTETEALYQMVFKTPLSLVYGLSGTGKTSLIKCGLANKFDSTDWYPFWIRRQNDLNQSLQTSLHKALKDKVKESLVENVSYLFRYYLRPVYLIFDQFEELFILGSSEEQEKFMQDIADLLAAELPCKILFVIREEYLGQLYYFEKYVPTLFDQRLRVERMNPTKVKEVMTKSFEAFNIGLEGSEEDRCDEIVKNLQGSKKIIQLPYLQVYLDMFYRQDFARTYPGQVWDPNNLQSIEFSKNEIKSFGTIEKVLNDFLSEQENALQSLLEQTYTRKKIPRGTIRAAMDAFATESGTKRPMKYTRDEEIIQIEEQYQDLFPKIPPQALSELIEQLEQRRILRLDGENCELAHDSLASLIDQNRTDEQRKFNEVKNRISHSYTEYQRGGPFLTKQQLHNIRKYVYKLPKELQDFFGESEENVKDQERKKEEELIREKALREKAQLFTRIAVFVALIAIGVGIYATTQTSRAREEVGKNYEGERRYNDAIGLYERAKLGGWYRVIHFNRLIKTAENQKERMLEHEKFISQGDSFQSKGPDFFPEAMEQFKAAQLLAYDTTVVNSKMKLLEVEMKQALKNYEAKGDDFKNVLENIGNASSYTHAKEAYRIAYDLDTTNLALKSKIESLTQNK